MSDITIVTNAAALSQVPRCATDNSYSDPGQSWDGQPTKVAPSNGMIAQGRLPNAIPPAEFENYYTAKAADAIIELQLQQPPVAAGFTNLSDSALLWQRNRKLLLQHQVLSGPAEKRVTFSPNVNKATVAAMTNAFGGTGFEWRLCLCIGSIVNSDLSYFLPNLPNGGDTGVLISDGTSDSTFTLPGTSSTTYTDLVSAHDGSGVLLLGGLNTVFKLGKLPLVGSPGTVTIGSPWSSDPYGVLVSSPTETRAWQCDATVGKYTFATTDGGATVSSTLATTWNGGTPDATQSLMRPCWDSVNNRWIASTANITSYANMQSTSELWTSEDGIAWTSLRTSPKVLFVTIKEHRGLLWAIGLRLQDHKGMEIYVSKDGGTSWARTGHVLTLAQFDPSTQNLLTFHRDTRIESMSGAYLCFQTGVSIASTMSGGAEGIDFLILRTSDMYDS